MARRRFISALVTCAAVAGSLLATSPPTVAAPAAQGDLAKGRILSFNDFHGALDAPTGSGGLVNGVPAGGAEYLATTLANLRADAAAKGQKVITAGAGDMVGASPLLSAAFHDEPTIESLNLMKMDVTAVGNHEFDEGVDELLRLQNGGCHPTDGCQDGDPFYGADFPYLAANVVYKDTGRPILPAYTVKQVQGVPVGFIGMTLTGTAAIVNPAGIQEVDFLDEVQTANKYAAVLRAKGVKALVLLLHQGGQQNGGSDPNGCANLTGDELKNIVAGLDPAFDLVISGHTHRSYVCSLPDSAGEPTVVTSAATNGVLVTDITVTLSRHRDQFASISARNVVVENGVKNPDGTYQKDAKGNFVRNPALVDQDEKVLLDKYRTAIAPLANKVVGSITADLTRTPAPSQETPLGDVIADAQLAYTRAAGAQIALMNPGGIRADLPYATSAGGEAPGQVTYGEAFTVQPFNNLVVTQTLTGAQLKDVLEQQFVGYAGQTSFKLLQVSTGFTYRYDTTQPLGSRISGLALDGTPIDPAASYRVTTNDFLANGGDGFTNLKVSTARVYAPGFDIDAFTAYLGSHSPVAPGPADRVTKVA